MDNMSSSHVAGFDLDSILTFYAQQSEYHLVIPSKISQEMHLPLLYNMEDTLQWNKLMSC